MINENFFGLYENAFSDEYCDRAIEWYDSMVASGFGWTRRQSNGHPRTVRDNTQVYVHNEKEINMQHAADLTAEFNDIFWGSIYPEYAERYAILENSDPHGCNSFKMHKNEVGQAFHQWHYESSERGTSNRLLVWLLYLNDVEEGGETEFLYYGKRFSPKKGSLLLTPAGFTHAHRGNPVLKGVKYTVTGWVEF